MGLKTITATLPGELTEREVRRRFAKMAASGEGRWGDAAELRTCGRVLSVEERETAVREELFAGSTLASRVATGGGLAPWSLIGAYQT